ncbi:helix-turn-helix transcriptional regulator [Jejudonia soesokkakensis]|uniref:Helix-turn-helix transcriptional regulator n=1 Tax=Jejudonia soesokkakensis TaxID=1323432 RepID=A0ABW2MWH1_9FLAO
MHGQKQEKFIRFVDSADVYVHDNPDLAWEFLNSIPTPVSKSIEGRLADYYMLKGMLYHKSGDQAKILNSFILAIKYGEKEKNYDVAGRASLDLFSNIYVVKKDSSAFKYLEDAKRYYTKTNNINGLVEVMQMPAYVAFQNHEYQKSISLLLENLEIYKNVEDDAYYYLFANYMLVDSYIHLGDLENANKYLKIYHSLQTNPTIDSYNYRSYETNLNVCMASEHLSRKEVDSALYYLREISDSKEYMDYVAKQNFYRYFSEAYKMDGNLELSKVYLDSLKNFEQELLDSNLTASFDISETLLQSEEELKSESYLKQLNRNWVIILIIVLLFLIAIFSLYYKKLNKQLNSYINQRRNYSHLSSSYEKLKVKTLNLEEYLAEIKKEIKKIAAIDEASLQRQKIRDIYKKINLESTTLISNGENHLNLINDLNIDFFNNLKTQFSKLNDSEIIICYYLAMDFKNKEIALFLNRTIRAIESKRYRISKKVGLKNGNDSLSEYLKEFFSTSEDKQN